MHQDQHAALKDAVASFRDCYPLVDGLDGAPFKVRRQDGRQGRPIVLMPGASGTAEFFSLVVEPLRELGLDPITIDYAGTVAPGRLASALADFVKAAELEAPVILGCSYSAWWMQLLPAEFAQEATLIFSNGFVEVADLLPNPLFDAAIIDATPADELQAQWLERAQGQQGPLAYLLCQAMSAWLPAEDLKGRLLHVARSEALPRQAPSGKAAIIDCEDDALVGAKARTRFRATWSGARHIEIGGGHYPYVNNPDGFVRAVSALLE